MIDDKTIQLKSEIDALLNEAYNKLNELNNNPHITAYIHRQAPYGKFVCFAHYQL